MRKLQRDIEQLRRPLADVIQTALPIGAGFTLIMFGYGDSGACTYISTADRQDNVKVLREIADVLERHGDRETLEGEN